MADVSSGFGKDASSDINFLHIPTFCVCILIVFNDRNHDAWSYSEISEATRIPDTELVRNLQIVSMGNYKILKRKEAGWFSGINAAGNSSSGAQTGSGSGSASINANNLFVSTKNFLSRNIRV